MSKDRFAEAEFQYAGPVYGEEEIDEMIKALRSGRFWGGEYVRKFEKDLAEYLQVKRAIFCNSGSSALLLAMTALNIPRGSRVVTQALAFPTTVNVIVMNGLRPVFVDVEIDTLSVNPEVVLRAINQTDAKAYLQTYTIGNCPDMKQLDEVIEAIPKKVLYIVDTCDTLGSRFNGKDLATFGKAGCLSFHPAHIISCGLGGAVVTDDRHFGERVEALRDWGRIDQTRVEDRFVNEFDMRYFYPERGFNLQGTEVMAAMGVVQLKKIEEFNKIRRRNFSMLKDFFSKYGDRFFLPKVHPSADIVWFGYPVIIKRGGLGWGSETLNKFKLMEKFEAKGIQCRSMYGGTITSQPGYRYIDFIQHKGLENSDYLSRYAFWIGIYQGLTEERMKEMIERIEGILSSE